MAAVLHRPPNLRVGDRTVHPGAGRVSITQLPVAQYPTVAPPSIVITAAYPGASAQTLEDSVISVIEREMNGSPGLIYMESVSQANGSGQITLSFEPGTNSDQAQVDVQNRLGRATPRLPPRWFSKEYAWTRRVRTSCCSRSCPATTRPSPGGAGRLRRAQRAARIAACARRWPGAALRHRARDAHLDRPGKTGGLQPVAERRQQRHSRAERAGHFRHHRRVAEPGRAGDLRDGGGRRPTEHGRAVRRHRAARQHRRLHGAAEGRGAHRTRCAELRHLGAAERQAFHRHRRATVAHRQCAGHREGGSRAHGPSCRSSSPPASSTAFPTTARASSRSRSVRSSKRCSRRWRWCSW